MSDEEWREATDPQVLLALLDKASPRKQRLFAVACCRLAWILLTDERSQEAVLVAERYADGEAAIEELQQARAAAFYAAREARTDGPRAAHYVAVDEASLAVEHVSWCLTRSGGSNAQSDVLRDLFGGPLHRLDVSPSLLTWNGGTVAKVAQAIYAEQRFEDVPVLADALEEAGFTDNAILNHFRGPGPHVRGCWALDLLVGKS